MTSNRPGGPDDGELASGALTSDESLGEDLRPPSVVARIARGNERLEMVSDAGVSVPEAGTPK